MTEQTSGCHATKINVLRACCDHKAWLWIKPLRTNIFITAQVIRLSLLMWQNMCLQACLGLETADNRTARSQYLEFQSKHGIGFPDKFRSHDQQACPGELPRQLFDCSVINTKHVWLLLIARTQVLQGQACYAQMSLHDQYTRLLKMQGTPECRLNRMSLLQRAEPGPASGWALCSGTGRSQKSPLCHWHLQHTQSPPQIQQPGLQRGWWPSRELCRVPSRQRMCGTGQLMILGRLRRRSSPAQKAPNPGLWLCSECSG